MQALKELRHTLTQFYWFSLHFRGFQFNTDERKKCKSDYSGLIKVGQTDSVALPVCLLVVGERIFMSGMCGGEV